MSYFLVANNELDALHDLLQLIMQKGKTNGNCLEVLNCLLSIHYNLNSWKDFCNFKDEYLRIGGEAARVGWNRASRVYTNRIDRMTKPSYLKRLEEYPDSPRKNSKIFYVFSWDEVPGRDNEKILEFLRVNFNIIWSKKSKIEKIENGRVIKISNKDKFILLEINDKNTEVNLKIDEDRSIKLIPKMENKTLNIYSKFFNLNQIEKISAELAKKPGFSNLSFVIFRPADLYDQFRPGYVPCPIAGDFKFRDGQLNLSVMFRTNDAFGVGYADIFYLRNLQIKTLRLAQERSTNKKLKDGRIGDLNIYFCRTFIEKSRSSRGIDSTSSERIRIIPIVDKLIKSIENFQLSLKVIG